MNRLNKKGFTLIELLATVVLLGVISVIAVVSVDKLLDRSRETECENILLGITNAAKEYASDNRFSFTSKSFSKNVKTYLINSNYLSNKKIMNPFDKKKEVDTNRIYVHFTLADDYTVNSIEIKNGSAATSDIIKCKLDPGNDNTGLVLFPGYTI